MCLECSYPGLDASIKNSADAKILALSREAQPAIELWDLVTGAYYGAVDYGRILDNRVISHDDMRPLSITVFQFSPDSRLLVSATDEATAVVLWDIASLTVRGWIDSQLGSRKNIAFSPNGHLLALSEADGTTIELWDVASQTRRGLLEGRLDGRSTVFAADSSSP